MSDDATMLTTRWWHSQSLRDLVRLTPHDTASQRGRSRERYRRLALSTIASLNARAVAVAVGLLTVPLTYSYLGTERFGLWMTIASLAGMVAFADFGIGNGLLNAVSEANGKDRDDLAITYISSAFFLLSIVALALAGLLLLVYPVIPWARIFNLSSAQAIREAGPAAAVFLFCTLLSVPLDVVIRVRMGYQEGFVNSVWDALGSLAGLGGLLLATAGHASLPWLVLALAGGPVLGTAANALALSLRRAHLRPRFTAVRAVAVRRLLSTGALFAGLQVVVAAVYLSDNLVVAQIFGPDAVASYSVHAKLFGLAPLVVSIGVIPLWPAYGEAMARGDTGWVKQTLMRSMLATFLLVSFVSLFLIFAAPLVLRVWLGAEVSSSLALLLGFAAWALLSALGNAVAMFLNGVNMLRTQLVLACAMAGAAMVGKVILAQHIGISGVVWATVAAYTLFTALPLAVLIPRALSRLEPQHGDGLSR